MSKKIRSLLIILAISASLYLTLIWLNKAMCEGRAGTDPVRYTYLKGCEVYTLSGWRTITPGGDST